MKHPNCAGLHPPPLSACKVWVVGRRCRRQIPSFEPKTDVLHWDEFQVPKGHISLPTETENRAEEIKNEYLDWVTVLSKTKFADDKDLVETLAVDGHRSLWWLSLIHEKSPLRTQRLVEVFRLRAFEKIAERKGWSDVIYLGRDAEVQAVLKEFCRRSGRSFTWDETWSGKVAALLNKRALLSLVPQFFLGLVYLFRFFWIHWLLIRSRSKGPRYPREMCVVTYFPNVDEDKLLHGLFRSRYLGPLHELLENAKSRIHWVWLYSYRSTFSASRAVKAKELCQDRSSSVETFQFIQEFFSWRGLLWALSKWITLSFRSLRLRPITHHFMFQGSKICFYRILRFDWRSSVRGYTALGNLISMSLFDGLARALCSRGEPLLYIWENQPWELLLLWAWKKQGGGKTIGIQHSALPPLLLRSFNREELYRREAFGHPIPDILVVNGEKPKKQLSQTGYPSDKIIIAEALRYQYLLNIKNVRRSRTRILLVATGYLRSEAERQINILKDVFDGFRQYKWNVLIKPHPYLSIDSRALARNQFHTFEIVEDPISTLIEKCDKTFVANMSAVAVESLFAGIPTAVHVDPMTLNLSPLFGDKSAVMVQTAGDLTSFLIESNTVSLSPDWFRLGNDLESWRDILNREI